MEASPNDRRLLLTEDAQTQVWLDLDSGQEVTRAVEQGAPAGDTEGAGATCARLDPLFPAILEWVRSVEIPWHQFAPEGVVFPLAA